MVFLPRYIRCHEAAHGLIVLQPPSSGARLTIGMASMSLTRQRSVSNRFEAPQIVLPKGKDLATDEPFEPCAATASHFLFSQGSTILVLHHDTLALARRFQSHIEPINLISVDNVSERGQGRLVVTYDIGKTAIIWDLFTGEQISRFASYEPILVASWMRNGNIAFGKFATRH